MPGTVNVLTLNQQVADRVREDIIAGRIRAGQRLSQDLLGQQLGVSRTPIREALRILEREGLVTYYPRMGAIVAELSPADLEELYEIRSVIESHNARLAIPHIRDEDVGAMESFLERMAEAGGKREQWFAAHEAFHRTLNVRSGRPRMNGLIDDLRKQAERYIRVYRLVTAAGGDLLVQHRGIFEAVRARDVEAAGRSVRWHLELVRDRVLEYLRGRAAGRRSGSFGRTA